jgi:predicted nucleic acid-binding protein
VIHLDTNYLINVHRPGSPEFQQFGLWLGRGEALGVSAVAWAEFLCGPVAAAVVQDAARIFTAPEPFTADDAPVAAELFNIGGRRRGSMGDCMIAAVCLRVGATLATSNVADFARFQPHGLQLVTP